MYKIFGASTAPGCWGNAEDLATTGGRVSGEQVTTMLTELGQAADGAAHRGGHSTGMAGHGGIMNDADMDALRDATGSDAARLYLEGMVKHHQGAIEAREAEIADGQYGPAVELAKKMKTAQAAEITEMQALLQSL